MDGAFEGDLIRPLGLMTLYFGYAEFEVDALLDALNAVGLARDTPKNAPLGQKLAVVREELTRLPLPEAAQVISLIDQARPRVDLRNVLVHSCILAEGRARPSDKSQRELTVTPEQLTALANEIFTWKEHLSAIRQKQLTPALQRMFAMAPNNRWRGP